MSPDLLSILSFIPIISLIFISLIKDIKTSAFVTFIATTFLFFLWNSPFTYFLACLVSSLLSTVNILMIVFGAIFLFNVLEVAGTIKRIKHGLHEVHPSKQLVFFLIAIGLTGFFEGVAGFGTPGAIVPPILISLGHPPIFSVATVLLFDGIFASFGAVGTPLIAGIKTPLSLPEADIKHIALWSALLLVGVGLLFVAFVTYHYKEKQMKHTHIWIIFLLYFFFAVPFVLFAWFIPELTTILSAMLMILASLIFLSKGIPKIDFEAWLPYLFLVVLLMLPKIILPLAALLDYDLHFDNIFSTPISASIKPFRSPMLPFLLVSFYLILITKKEKPALQAIFKKMLSVFLILFPILCVSQMMMHSGYSYDSMIDFMTQVLGKTGKYFTLVSPYIGITGSFITGSTTVSNIVFSLPQWQISEHLDLPPIALLSLQHAGAAIGNAICLFNIVAAASVAEIEDQTKILSMTMLPTLCGGLLIGVLGSILLL